MKKLVVAVIAISVIAMAGMAMAGDSNTLTVSANVVGTCKFSAATSTLAFGALDPTLATDATATGSTTFWCTKGASYTVTDDDGLYETGANANRMRHETIGTEYIPYALTYTPTSGSGSGKTSTITLNISGTIANANYVNASAGNYSDTVTLSITP